MCELPTPQPVPRLPDDLPGTSDEYEYRVITFPRDIPGSVVRRALAEHAEYGHWELARVRRFMGGARRVWIRRRIIRITRTA